MRNVKDFGSGRVYGRSNNAPMYAGAVYGAPAEPEPLPPEDPALTENEARRLVALGINGTEALARKVRGYEAEMRKQDIGDGTLGQYLADRPRLVSQGFVPAEVLWIEETDGLATAAAASGMSVEAFEAFGRPGSGEAGAMTEEDYRGAKDELARKAEIREAARRELAVEQAKREIGIS